MVRFAERKPKSEDFISSFYEYKTPIKSLKARDMSVTSDSNMTFKTFLKK